MKMKTSAWLVDNARTQNAAGFPSTIDRPFSYHVTHWILALLCLWISTSKCWKLFFKQYFVMILSLEWIWTNWWRFWLQYCFGIYIRSPQTTRHQVKLLLMLSLFVFVLVCLFVCFCFCFSSLKQLVCLGFGLKF